MDREYTCQECEAEFDVEYDFVATPEFCPFCGDKLQYDDRDLDNSDWEDDDTDRGC